MFKDTRDYCRLCETCQKSGALILRSDMPLTSLLTLEKLDVWGIDYIGLFPSLGGYLSPVSCEQDVPLSNDGTNTNICKCSAEYLHKPKWGLNKILL